MGFWRKAKGEERKRKEKKKEKTIMLGAHGGGVVDGRSTSWG